jgi:hypothetical protein
MMDKTRSQPMATIIQIEATCCLCCDTVIDAIEPIAGTPKIGTVPMNVTICGCCGHLMIVELDLTLREPTTDELGRLTKHPTIDAERRRSVN